VLVYANSFSLDPSGGGSKIIEQIAMWVGRPRKTFVDPTRLAEGINELRFSDGASLTSLSTTDGTGGDIFPYYLCVRLTHGQPGVPGRRWISEIGLKQVEPTTDIETSVLLRIDEISAKVYEPIQVTRPRIVELLVT